MFYVDLFISATFFQFKFRFAGSYYASCNKPHDQTLKQIRLLSQMFLPNKISEEHFKAEKQRAEAFGPKGTNLWVSGTYFLLSVRKEQVSV